MHKRHNFGDVYGDEFTATRGNFAIALRYEDTLEVRVARIETAALMRWKS
jgi:hypothetical protein